MVTNLVCTVLLVISTLTIIIGYILDRMNRKKSFVTSLSVTECRNKCRLKNYALVREFGKPAVWVNLISEINNEILLKKTSNSQERDSKVISPLTIRLRFQGDGDSTVVKCNLEGLAGNIGNYIGVIFFGGLLVNLILTNAVIIFGGTDSDLSLSTGEYCSSLWISIAVSYCCFTLASVVNSVWKDYVYFLNSNLNAKEVEK